MSDDDVAEKAKRDGTTRAVASMEKACELDEKLIFAIGNAPTALIHLYELIRAGKIRPELVIGVPVGFVNVIQSKELILKLSDTPYIVARGRKGGSEYCSIVSAMHCCIIFKNSAIIVSTDRILFLVFAAPLISDFHGKLT